MHMPFLTQQLDEATRTRRTQTRPNLPTSTGRPPLHRLLPLSSAGSQSSDYMMTSSRKLLMLLLCFMLQLASLVAFAGPAAPATAVPRSRRGGFVQVASSGIGLCSPVLSTSRLLAAPAGDDEEEDDENDDDGSSTSRGSGASSSSFSASSSTFKGKHRRALRSLAGRKKAEKSLFTMQQSETPPSERFRIEVETALRAHELVNIRVLFAAKKKEAKVVGEIMAEAVSAELVQVIGHTYLLFKPGDPPRIDMVKLTAEAPAE